MVIAGMDFMGDLVMVMDLVDSVTVGLVMVGSVMDSVIRAFMPIIITIVSIAIAITMVSEEEVLGTLVMEAVERVEQRKATGIKLLEESMSPLLGTILEQNL